MNFLESRQSMIKENKNSAEFRGTIPSFMIQFNSHSLLKLLLTTIDITTVCAGWLEGQELCPKHASRLVYLSSLLSLKINEPAMNVTSFKSQSIRQWQQFLFPVNYFESSWMQKQAAVLYDPLSLLWDLLLVNTSTATKPWEQTQVAMSMILLYNELFDHCKCKTSMT